MGENQTFSQNNRAYASSTQDLAVPYAPVARAQQGFKNFQ